MGLLVAVERIPPRTILRGLVPFLFFAGTSAWIYALAPDPRLGAGSAAGWSTGLLVALRILATGLVSMAFALTTEPAALARALVHRARLPRRFVYGTLAAIQFLPALAEDARLSRLIARGAAGPVGGSGRGFAALRRALAGFSPGIGLMLLAGAIRRAGAAALAMELRGLSAARPVAPWRVPHRTARDEAFAAGAALLLAGLSLWRP